MILPYLHFSILLQAIIICSMPCKIVGVIVMRHAAKAAQVVQKGGGVLKKGSEKAVKLLLSFAFKLKSNANAKAIINCHLHGTVGGVVFQRLLSWGLAHGRDFFLPIYPVLLTSEKGIRFTEAFFIRFCANVFNYIELGLLEKGNEIKPIKVM